MKSPPVRRGSRFASNVQHCVRNHGNCAKAMKRPHIGREPNFCLSVVSAEVGYAGNRSIPPPT
jgi:hypothetical protein